MLKVVVFGCGWGGELVADFLEVELDVVEIVRVIDWRGDRYEGRSRAEIYHLVELSIEQYINKVDVIVLGGYLVSLVISDLQKRYPRQAFVGMGINYDLVLRSTIYPDRIVPLYSPKFDGAAIRAELQENLPYSTFIIPDCSGWEKLIDEDLMTEDALRVDLGYDFVLMEKRASTSPLILAKRLREEPEPLRLTEKKPQCSALLAAIEKFEQASSAAARDEAKLAEHLRDHPCNGTISPNVVLLLNTHFWGIKPELERLFGWRVRVIDFREKLLHDVCAALHLRGVHGKRAK